VRYGITNLVEGKSWRPRAGRGVLGLSGDCGLPTLDLPENNCCILVRILSSLDDGTDLEDRVEGDRLEVPCLTGGIVLDA